MGGGPSEYTMPTEPDEGYLDDEFAKFRAARLKKGAAPLEPHATATQTPPRTTRPPPPPLPTREHPHEPASPPARDEHPTGPGRRLEVLEEPAPGDDFERFRAQRLRETGKLQRVAEPAAEVALEPTTLPAPEPAKDDAATRPTVRLAEPHEDGLFVGTSTTERLQIRAHAREARADGDVPPPKGDEAA